MTAQVRAKRNLRVLVIDAHPRRDSLCHALANAVTEGARSEGHEVSQLILRELQFDQNERGQDLEADVLKAQELLAWSEHMIFVFPVWWGTMPALLKGFLDRVFREGVTFEEHNGNFRGLLTGRSGELVYTLDTPQWIYRLFLRSPCVRALKHATLAFCGVSPVRTRAFGPLRKSSCALRQKWLTQVHAAGRGIEHNFYTGWRPRLGSWLVLGRLHFFPFPWLALTLGAVFGAVESRQPLDMPVYAGACLSSVFAELITVITNEIHDFDTDSVNRNNGPFTGGSRVLVTRRLDVHDLRLCRRVMAGLLSANIVFLWTQLGHAQSIHFVMLGCTGLFLGLQYSAPPLRLSRCTLGEVTVAFTHSILVILLGYFSQATAWSTGALLLGVPTFFAVLPSIILAGFPDYDADKKVGKRTLAVTLGQEAAGTVALSMVVGSVVCYFVVFRELRQPIASVALITHATLLAFFLVRFIRKPRVGRIDSLLFGSLTFMVWFVAAPLLHFWNLYQSQH